MLKKSLLAFLLIFLSAGAAFSSIPASVKKQLHKNIPILIITNRNVKDIEKLTVEGNNYKITVIQTEPEAMTPERVQILMDWVRAGGTLWFYDSRMAEFFGMENSPVEKDKFRCQLHSDLYGDISKRKGANCIGQAPPFGEHPVLTGVNNVQTFIISVGENEFSAVKFGGDVIPLLQVNVELKAIAAIRKEGNGQVILKPLIWIGNLSGDRFQANLLEFSGGYPVPGLEKSIIPADKLEPVVEPTGEYDLIRLSDERDYKGKIQDKTITFETFDETLKVSRGDIAYIKVDGEGDEILLKDGKKKNGFLRIMGGLTFKLPNGKQVKLNREDIFEIHFGITSAPEPEVKDEGAGEEKKGE